ncbi:glycosyltransferase [Curtobacterium sp. MCBD17_032]|uniref:glycosyltransferase n=1 Tax=Curtobacterium sp. MCBD17_032 TaxID=2175659 RepID=UPI0011B84778|nr:glycosyltransferase [Curtobacterium sp. MCBD17_032]
MRPVVAFVTHSAQPSGAELFVLRVVRAVERVRPLVVLGEHGPLERDLRAAGVDTVVVPLTSGVRAHTGRSRPGVLTLARHVVDVIAVAVRVAMLLRRRGVGLVTTHSAKAHVYGALAARLARTPVLAHVHSVVGTRRDAGRNARLLRAALRVLPHGLVANSAATARSVRPPASRPVSIVPCPVALPRPVDDAPRRSAPHRPVFVLVGRIARGKGQDVVLRALARGRATGGLDGACVRLVGSALFPDDVAHEGELRDLVTRLDLEDVVEFVGQVDDVAAELARATAALHASVEPEGFAQVVVEAMASSCPVIATAAGGPAELVSDGVDGLLVVPGDPDTLAAAMTRVASDPGLRARLAAAGRETAQRYDIDRVVDALETVLLGALPPRAASERPDVRNCR